MYVIFGPLQAARSQPPPLQPGLPPQQSPFWATVFIELQAAGSQPFFAAVCLLEPHWAHAVALTINVITAAETIARRMFVTPCSFSRF
jgi:hypothetical protein